MAATQTFQANSPVELAMLFHMKVNSCQTFSSLNVSCLRLAMNFGLKAVAYHHLPQFGADDDIGLNIISVGFPKALVERYESEGLFKVDPSIRQVMSETKAHSWRELEYSSRLSREEKEYLESASSETGEGLILPVFGPNGRNGFVSLGFGEHKPDWDEGTISLLQSCCQFAHLQYCALLKAELPNTSKLSPREAQVLSWVAHGKSNGVIAEILDIAESTVITHLERTYKKLGVANRVTAALRALSVGEFSYLP